MFTIGQSSFSHFLWGNSIRHRPKFGPHGLSRYLTDDLRAIRVSPNGRWENPRGLAMDTYIYIYIHSWETGGIFRPYYWLPKGLSWASCVLFINFYIPWNKKGKKICWTSFRVIICCPLLWLGQKVKVHREPVQHCFWSQSEWTRWSSKVDV